MTLRSWLNDVGLTHAWVASELDLRNDTVDNWVRGYRRPGIGSMKKIEKLTRGAVKVRDWWGK